MHGHGTLVKVLLMTLVGPVIGGAPDANTLLDPGDRAFIRNRNLIEKYYADLTAPQWDCLGSDFRKPVEANNFFLTVGARSTVEKILRLYASVQAIPSIAATSPK